MGWSCTKAACNTMDRLSDWCAEHDNDRPDGHGAENVFLGTNKCHYFWDHDGVEHNDGKITGKIHAFNGLEAGVFQIENDGRISRFDHLPPEARQAAQAT